jgi:hypothetical protein
MYVTKHRQQVWAYELPSAMVFTGGNAWETRKVPASERAATMTPFWR